MKTSNALTEAILFETPCINDGEWWWGTPQLRIRLSIVVYDVHRRLMEPVNCRVRQQRFEVPGGRIVSLPTQKSPTTTRTVSRTVRGTCTCCLGGQGANRCCQWNSRHPQQNTAFAIRCRVLAAKAFVEWIPVDFGCGGLFRVPWKSLVSFAWLPCLTGREPWQTELSANGLQPRRKLLHVVHSTWPLNICFRGKRHMSADEQAKQTSTLGESCILCLQQRMQCTRCWKIRQCMSKIHFCFVSRARLHLIIKTDVGGNSVKRCSTDPKLIRTRHTSMCAC